MVQKPLSPSDVTTSHRHSEPEDDKLHSTQQPTVTQIDQFYLQLNESDTVCDMRCCLPSIGHEARISHAYDVIWKWTKTMVAFFPRNRSCSKYAPKKLIK